MANYTNTGPAFIIFSGMAFGVAIALIFFPWQEYREKKERDLKISIIALVTVSYISVSFLLNNLNFLMYYYADTLNIFFNNRIEGLLSLIIEVAFFGSIINMLIFLPVGGLLCIATISNYRLKPELALPKLARFSLILYFAYILNFIWLMQLDYTAV